MIEADQGILEIVAALRRAGIYCAIASTQEAVRAGFMSASLNYASVFDRQFYSHALGISKPDARYFEAIVAQAKLDPARTLFIDDREENVLGARAVGLQAAQFQLAKVGRGAAPMRALLAGFGLNV